MKSLVVGSDILCGPQPVMSPPTSFSLVVAARVHLESMSRPCSRASSPTITTWSAITMNHRSAERHGGQRMSLCDLVGLV
jgi:hypothetical protein